LYHLHLHQRASKIKLYVATSRKNIISLSKSGRLHLKISCYSITFLFSIATNKNQTKPQRVSHHQLAKKETGKKKKECEIFSARVVYVMLCMCLQENPPQSKEKSCPRLVLGSRQPLFWPEKHSKSIIYLYLFYLLKIE